MATPVPADDLPGNLVPASDLPSAPAEPKKPLSFADRVILNGVGGIGAVAKPMANGYDVGGLVTDYAAKVLPPKGAAALGVGANMAFNAVPAFAGGIAAPGASAMQAGGRSIMQRAMKPVLPDLLSGKAARAGQTFIDEGLNVTPAGTQTLRDMAIGQNEKAGTIIAQSPATVGTKEELATYARPVIERAKGQVNSASDLATARASVQEFLNSEAFNGLGTKEKALAKAILEKTASKQAAVQEAGKFAANLAEQEHLASNWFPVQGMPKAPYRYSPNAERVPEATGAFNDALVIANQRKIEEEFLRRQMEHLPANERSDQIPIQLAQRLKQGTYQKLKDKYGEMGSTAVETQKALAHGLRAKIEEAAPAVTPVNARASELWNALNVSERRALMAGNNNLLGLSMLAKSPEYQSLFLLDRSPLAQSVLARAIYNSGRAPGLLGGGAGSAAMAIQRPQGQ